MKPPKEPITPQEFEVWLRLNYAGFGGHAFNQSANQWRRYENEQVQRLWEVANWMWTQGWERGIAAVNGPETRFGLADKLKPELLGKKIRDWAG